MRIPVATYRLQFNPDFTLAHARELLPYLRELGISDIYASPLFLATPGSSHGYDVCGYDRINPSLGITEELEQLAADSRQLGMGLVMDLVPNHMGLHPSNCWWHNVLKHGEKSKYARFFDINWNSPAPGLRGKVLLPLLGDHYSSVLERGELKLKTDADSVHLAYFDQTFPLSPESEERFGPQGAATEEQRKAVARRTNADLDELHQLIQMQNYRLAYWRAGLHEINYRRFFDVTGLISVRMEDEEVFRASHQFVFDLVRSGIATGLRIDHPDGMRDPQKYFEDLQKGAGGKIYVVAEKILARDEPLPESWPVEGTTGYDYLNYLNGIFILQKNEAAFTELYQEFTGCASSYSDVAYRSKQDMLRTSFVPEVNALARRLKRIASQTRCGVDFTEPELRIAMADFAAAFPVYRNYVTDRSQNVSPWEQQNIKQALEEAKRRTQSTEKRSLDFLAQILSLECDGFPEDLRAEVRDFAVRFQQLSGPATAKGLEDTAFYRYTRFVTLNEVGGEPGQFGVSLEEFHEHNRQKFERHPYSLLATATHDTKRGEDVRARLNVLTEIPGEWKQTVLRWRDLNKSFKSNDAPSSNDEYLLYQTLVGTWTSDNDPSDYSTRIEGYMLKAIREAKCRTSWIDPDETYETATVRFVHRCLESPEFVAELNGFSESVAFYGALNSLAQVLFKTCSPGVPDFYQGTELWDLSLVDPDNRRPVDYSLRREMFRNLRKKSPADLLKDWKTGMVKLFTMASTLEARKQHREIFQGAYHPIQAIGIMKDHLVAFARTAKGGTIIATAPRFIRTLMGGSIGYPGTNIWDDTALDFPVANGFRNLLTNETHDSLAASDLFKTFPVALLLALD